MLLQVVIKKTAKQVWDNLKTRYLGADRVKKARLQTLKSEFDALRMKDGESIDEFAGKLRGIATHYSNLGTTLENAALVRKLLNSVPEKFFPVIAGIKQFYDIDTMPLEEAIGSLKAYEERVRLHGGHGNNDGQLLLTHAKWQARQKSGGEDVSSSSKGRGASTGSSDGCGHSKGYGRGHGRGKGGRGGSNTTR